MEKEQIARVAHEINKAYCESLGDFSQPSWANAPDWQKESILAGVELHMSDDVTPEESHAAWVAKKIKDGWAYGSKKNEELKIHPNLTTYDQLPKEQRVKDHIFRAVVRSLMII